MTARDQYLIVEFKRRLLLKIKEHIRKIIIFGSRARGDSGQDSDLDVIALVDQKDESLEKQIENTAYQLMLENDFQPMISLKVFSEDQFEDALNRGFSFYRYVVKEGIVV